MGNGLPGEVQAQDRNHNPVLIAITYAGAQLIRMLRATASGFLVQGHAHEPTTPFDGLATVPEAPVTVEVDISEHEARLITVENGQNGNVTWSISGRTEAGATPFLLVSQAGFTPGSTQIETLSDAWAFLSIRASSDSALQSPGFVIKVARRT